MFSYLFVQLHLFEYILLKMYHIQFVDIINQLKWVDQMFHLVKKPLFEFLISMKYSDTLNNSMIVGMKIYLYLLDHSYDKEQHLKRRLLRMKEKELFLPENDASSGFSNNFFRSSKFSLPIMGVMVL